MNNRAEGLDESAGRRGSSARNFRQESIAEPMSDLKVPPEEEGTARALPGLLFLLR
jgi:hypothetical protein